MMVSSLEYPSRAISLKTETTKQMHMGMFLSAFALCLGIGSLLMLPLAPHYRLVGTHYCAALLPLLFTWWGFIIPVVTYWLFQQYVTAHWAETGIKRDAMPDIFSLIAHFTIVPDSNTQTVEDHPSDIGHRIQPLSPYLMDMTDHHIGYSMRIKEAVQPLIHSDHNQQATFYAGP